MGLGVTTVPSLFAEMPASVQILTSNGIVAGSLTAIALNILFNVIPGRKTGSIPVLEEQKVS
jgi:xanthine permease